MNGWGLVHGALGMQAHGMLQHEHVGQQHSERCQNSLLTFGMVSFCRANAQQPKLFVGMILILIFAEALALYGLIGESR